MADDMMRVLGISGSLREGSYNTALLRAAGEMLPAGMTLDIVTVGDLPLFNQDLLMPEPPEPVRRFKARVAAADALLFAAPEYNYSISGVLKNAIDWGSRPLAQNVFDGKPAALMGATTGLMGTARVQLHLRQIGVFVNLLILNQPQVLIARAAEKFDDAGRLTDEPTREHVRKLLVALDAWVRRLNPR
ncbi:MAG: hypothetical protein OJF49_001218 [Ktedonobacterales bacterium]|jgi:chromate reductase|nr:MAG: hypothetical protein OJF49_001218 [Ktedonobacterales bacterium]